MEDQLGLCCYCMNRVESRAFDPGRVASGCKIEHLVPQSGDPSRVLDWTNLLAACGGGEGRPRKQQTCDTSKGDLRLQHVDPLGTLPELTYGTDGRIKGPTPEIQEELDEVLNLNTAQLKSNRKVVYGELLKRVRAELGRRKHWSDSGIRRWRDRLAAMQPAPPYLGCLEYWLERLERRHS